VACTGLVCALRCLKTEDVRFSQCPIVGRVCKLKSNHIPEPEIIRDNGAALAYPAAPVVVSRISSRRGGPMDTSKPIPGNTADNPIGVRTVGGEYGYLENHPCTCGGAWQVGLQVLVPGAQGAPFVDQLNVRCTACGNESAFFFRVEGTAEEAEAELQAVEDALRDAGEQERKG
jgi:hypothetical protein